MGNCSPSERLACESRPENVKAQMQEKAPQELIEREHHLSLFVTISIILPAESNAVVAGVVK